MIRIEKLNKTYDRHRRHANHVLKDVTLTLPETGFVCILGPSGCGKTSLLNAIGGLDRFDDGTLSVGPVSVSRYGRRSYEAERNRSFGYIFQNYYLLPEHSVAYNIYLGLHSLKLSHREKLERIRQALEAVDMGRYIRRRVAELSGGQQQRIAIARALARRPRVIFADEPTGNLDESNTMNICTLLRKISRTSLVVMVTHEERIANFFADRIIKLDGGCIREDISAWQRDGLRMGTEREVYAGDYAEDILRAEQVSVRVLREQDAPPVEVTVVALQDRILIKLSDSRAVSCGTAEQVPALREGKRPTVTLEAVEQKQEAPEAPAPPAALSRAGRGIGFGMLLREALFLAGGGGARRIGLRLFLILLTVLTLWTAADYITVSAVDPREFMTTHSQILELKMKRGDVGTTATMLEEHYQAFHQALVDTGLEFDFVPAPSGALGFSLQVFPQLENVTQYLLDFSYVPLARLESATLLYGSYPTEPGQVVVDRWVLEALLEEDSILKNAVSDLSFFLNKQLTFDRGNVALTISGICQSREMAVYVGTTDLLRVASGMNTLMALSDFKAAHPGEYTDLQLSDGECIVNAYAAGNSYKELIGGQAGVTGFSWTILDAVETSDRASFIISDTEAQRYIRYKCSNRCYLYCPDKEAVKGALARLIQQQGNALVIDVVDAYTADRESYLEASRLKVDARLVVTLTVILLSMVMLYLLCRSQAQERIGMLAVYRLLGIPGRKLALIFALEAALSSLATALPAAGLTFLVITALRGIESLQLTLLLPWQAALGVYGAILGYHVLVALLPLVQLLRLPPAQLAAKYDY